LKEGQYVRRGTLLGEIGCDDLQAMFTNGDSRKPMAPATQEPGFCGVRWMRKRK